MTITTELNVGQTAWMMRDNKIVSLEVRAISILLEQTLEISYRFFFEKEFWMDESKVFASKEELLEHLAATAE